MEIKKNKFKNIELFAGAGGMALGLEQAGFEGLAFVEFSFWACQTLRKNRPEWHVLEEDIHHVDFKKYDGQIDLISGGPPCQAFSYAGKRLGFGDTRGTLFAEFVRCVKECHPKIFLFENVPGILSHDKGRTFQTILHEFELSGYTLQYQVLNACYYGVGQKRKRMFLVGMRNDLSDKHSFIFPRPDKEWTTLQDILKEVPFSEGQKYSEKKRQVMELVPPGGCWTDLPEEVAKAYMGKSYFSGGGRRGIARRISWDEPCLTLTTSPSQKQTERCHPEETRPFTVREYARIQSFPDEWDFEGGLSEQYRQIGNAVPVELARRIGESICQWLADIYDVKASEEEFLQK